MKFVFLIVGMLILAVITTAMGLIAWMQWCVEAIFACGFLLGTAAS